MNEALMKAFVRETKMLVGRSIRSSCKCHIIWKNTSKDSRQDLWNICGFYGDTKISTRLRTIFAESDDKLNYNNKF